MMFFKDSYVYPDLFRKSINSISFGSKILAIIISFDRVEFLINLDCLMLFSMWWIMILYWFILSWIFSISTKYGINFS